TVSARTAAGLRSASPPQAPSAVHNAPQATNSDLAVVDFIEKPIPGYHQEFNARPRPRAGPVRARQGSPRAPDPQAETDLRIQTRLHAPVDQCGTADQGSSARMLARALGFFPSFSV